MAKHERNIKAARNNEIQRIEHNEVFDDNLLPDAIEIERLHQLDPDILQWLKARAEQEQSFRHGAFDKRVNVVDRHNKRDHDTGRIALFIYLLLVGGCIAASYLLLKEGKNITGSIFGGAAIVLALAVLLTRRQPKIPESENKKNL